MARVATSHNSHSHNNNSGSPSVWMYVVGGLLQAFWLLAYGSLTAETVRLQKEVDRLYTRSEDVYTKKENTEQYRQRIAVEFKNVTTETANLVIQIRRLRDEVILKDTYNGRHEALIDDLKRQNSRIDELRRDFGGAYTLSDKIKELQDQLKVLQSRVMVSSKPNNSQ